jgi:rod shape-determining protein MreB
MLSRLFHWTCQDLAVDLGTVNTQIGVPHQGLVLHEPSAVAIDVPSREVLAGGQAVGHLARQLQGRTGESMAVVHPLRHGAICDYALCEFMLRQFLRKATRSRWRVAWRLLFAVPGGLTAVEKQALFASALRAGARRVLLILQSKAAAIGTGLQILEPAPSLICDIGGGTTEVAVLSVGEVVSAQSIRVGGQDMDLALADYLRRRYSLRVGLPTAERLREEIGSAYPLEQELTAEVCGIDTVSGLPRKATVSSAEVRDSLQDPLERIVEAVRATLAMCPTELAADLAESGMVLVGGGALLRGMARLLEERTGLPTRLADDPQSAVLRGALVCLSQLNQWRGTVESQHEDW